MVRTLRSHPAGAIAAILLADPGQRLFGSRASGLQASSHAKDQLQYWHDEDERTELASLLALISGGFSAPR